MDVHDWSMIHCPEAPVDGADFHVNFLFDGLVLLHSLARGDGDEEEDSFGVVQLLLLVQNQLLGLVPECGHSSSEAEIVSLRLFLPACLEASLELLQSGLPVLVLEAFVLALLSLLLSLLGFLQIALDRLQLVGHALGVVESLHTQDEALALELLCVVLQMLLERVCLHVVQDISAVRADGIHSQPGSASQVLHHVHLRCEATQTDHTRSIVSQVVVGVETDQIGPEHALNDVDAVRVSANDLPRWEWSVQEEADLQVLPCCSFAPAGRSKVQLLSSVALGRDSIGIKRWQVLGAPRGAVRGPILLIHKVAHHHGDHEQVVVVHPDDVARLGHLKDDLSKLHVHLPVALEPGLLEAGVGSHPMQERPQRGVRESVVEILDIILVKPDWMHLDRGIGLMESLCHGSLVFAVGTRPSDPEDLVVVLDDALECRDKAAGGLLNIIWRFLIRVDGHWQAVGDKDDANHLSKVFRQNQSKVSGL
mmetsp:Transcript_78582/g.172247  ORF Transcript_78582/g.172247 Transcript_78582/m.172247 type:complete len:479 (+) Transcript_78582:358-1794(+)